MSDVTTVQSPAAAQATEEIGVMPRRIFQTWKSKQDIPPMFAYWSETLTSINPTWEHVLWDDDDNRRFIAEHYPWFLEKYNGFRAEIYRADAIRYFFLYHFGGFYADMDVQCLRPLDVLRSWRGVILGQMGTDVDYPHCIPNAIMGSPPGEEFWLLVVSLMMSADPAHDPELVTGPVILRMAMHMYRYKYDSPEVERRLAEMRALMPGSRRSTVHVLPAHLLYPLSHHDGVHDLFNRTVHKLSIRFSLDEARRKFGAKAVTVTYWAHSWGGTIPA